MATKVELKPGWLQEDVKRAVERLTQWNSDHGPSKGTVSMSDQRDSSAWKSEEHQDLKKR